MPIQIKPSESFLKKHGMSPIENNEIGDWHFIIDCMTTFAFKGPYKVAANKARQSYRNDKQTDYGQVFISGIKPIEKVD